MTRRMRILLQLAMLGGLALFLGACNTIAGAGEDVQGVGRGIEQGAEQTEEAVFE